MEINKYITTKRKYFNNLSWQDIVKKWGNFEINKSISTNSPDITMKYLYSLTEQVHYKKIRPSEEWNELQYTVHKSMMGNNIGNTFTKEEGIEQSFIIPQHLKITSKNNYDNSQYTDFNTQSIVNPRSQEKYFTISDINALNVDQAPDPVQIDPTNILSNNTNSYLQNIKKIIQNHDSTYRSDTPNQEFVINSDYDEFDNYNGSFSEYELE